MRLCGRKIHCFATPTRTRADGKRFYDWVFNGEKLYQRLAKHFRLFDGDRRDGSICFETFPHAIVCALAGSVVPTKPKVVKRRAPQDPARATEVREAASELLQRLAPRERAAVLLKEVFDLSLEETASVLKSSVGAVKAALHRGRGRLERADRETPVAGPAPSRELVERFVKALGAKDIEGLRAICSADLTVELVGGAEAETFERNKTFFQHAHMVMPQLGFGENPHWQTVVYEGEPMALGYRTLGGVEGINEVHRLEEIDGRIARIRCYCFCPDTLRLLGEHLGIRALDRRYRSP